MTGSSDSSLGYDGDERDALYALRATFNNPFLNNNWTGIHCSMDDPRWYGIRCSKGHVTGIVLEGMGLKGLINFNALIHFSELSILSFKNNALLGEIMNFSGNPKLARIDLSGNKFHGPISKSLLSLALLASLQLQNNNLTGEIPEFNQSTLISFNVSNNDLSGPIPSTPLLQSFSLNSYLGNLGLYRPPLHNSCNYMSSPEPSSNEDPEKRKGHSNSGFHIFFLLFSMVALLAVILISILCYKKAKKLNQSLNQENSREEEAVHEKEEKSEAVESGGVVERGEDREKLILSENGGEFEYSDLLKASSEGIGKGIFGNTYKAIFNDRQALVVKILKNLKPMTSEEFMMRLQLLADQKHPNLIPPLTCFFSKQQKLLIYRYAEKGNLFNRIHGKLSLSLLWHSNQI
ncbi:hypothetical protein NL676_039372 [Syzygium grande]|nr:hypothetical protein NL676_039372 [Syzygium grande]